MVGRKRERERASGQPRPASHSLNTEVFLWKRARKRKIAR